MKTVRTIAVRELKALFDHPTGYILLIVFVAVTDFLYFGQVFLLGAASLRPMLDLQPWIFLFFVPAVTMRSLAEDARTGTLEVVLAQPVTELELLAGKYVGYLSFVLIGLGLTLPIPMGLALGADLHLGVMFSQYVGSALLGAALVAVGVWASSVTPNQITAFILGVAVMFGLILIGLNPLVTGLPASVGSLAANLAVLPHFENINRGVIDLRDAIYFVGLAGLFLAFAYFALAGRRLSRHGQTRRRLQAGTVLLAAIVIVINLFGRYIGGRLDLTPGNAYTLSSATKSLLRSLDDVLTITFYVSDEVPHGLEFLKRDVEDLLRDFRGAGGGKVRVVVLNPDDEEVASQARTAGVQPVQFNVVGEGALSVTEGYLGVTVQYADGLEAIPFVQRSDDLEYQLASYVRALTRTDRSAVGIIDATAAMGSPAGSFSALRQGLDEQYELRTVALEDSTPIADEIRVLVLLGSPPFLSDSQADRFNDFLRRGGGAFIAVSGMAPQQQGFMASPRPVGWNRLLAPYGVSVQPNLVYDLVSNEPIAFPVAGGQVLMNYPFWVRAVSTREASMNRDLEVMLMPWASGIAVTEAARPNTTRLFTTSQAGGIEAGQAFIHPQRDYPRDSLSVRVVAVAATPPGDSAGMGRVVLVGNSDFVSDRYVRSTPSGLLFALNAVDWLAEDEALIAIRSKNRQPPPLAYESEAVRDFVKWGNIVGVPLLLVLLGSLRLVQRRRRMKLRYGAAA